MKTSNSVWQRSHEYTEDLRKQPLPPLWAAKASGTGTRTEIGRRIHESGAGGEVANKLVALLDQAQEMALVCSFLLADERVENAMLAAAQRGVRVYALVASETRVENDLKTGEFDKRVQGEHKEMLKRLAGYVLFRSSEQFHAKCVLTDPFTDPAGILLTANLTREALNRNDELAIDLSPHEAEQLAQYARWAMWEAAEHEFVDPQGQFSAVEPLAEIEHPASGGSIVATTPESQMIRTSARGLIESANSQIIVSSFGWDAEHAVVEALCNKARAGVDVRVLCRPRPASMAALIKLSQAGAAVFGYKWLHAKAICVDSARAMIMTANLQTHGLDKGFEIGVRLGKADAVELETRLKLWMEGAPKQLKTAAIRGDVIGDVELWQNGKLEPQTMTEAAVINLGAVTADSAEVLDAPKPALHEPAPWTHQVHYKWEVVAPHLDDKAKPQGEPSKRKKKRNGNAKAKAANVEHWPAVFVEPGGRHVVAVRQPDELEAARALLDSTDAKVIVVAAMKQS